MKYSYDLLEADTMERLLFLMNANGQRGYKLVGRVMTTKYYRDDFENASYKYSCLMEREEELSAAEIEEEKKKEERQRSLEEEQRLLERCKRLFKHDYIYDEYRLI